jgi:hypothetical protein
MTVKRTVFFLGAAVLAASLSANADPWPHRKSGLWQVTITMQNSPMPPMTSKYCIDQATETALLNTSQGMMRESCSKRDVHVMGGTGTIDTVCKFGKYTQTAHTAVTFTGDSAYRSQTLSHMSPAMPYGGADHMTSVDARWTGPCPPSMKPGDMIMANGMRMHMNPNTK